MSRRVLHVVDPAVAGTAGRGAPAIALLACAGAIGATSGWEHTVLVLGGRDAAAEAARAGLRIAGAAALPLGEPVLGGRSLRRAVRGLGVFDAVQPWSDRSDRALRAAGLAGAAGAISAAVPSFESERPGRAARAALGVPQEVPIVALLADPAWHADARRFVYMVGLLDVAGIPIAGLIEPATAHLARARQFHSNAAVRWLMLLPQERVMRLVHACDMAVVLPPEPHRAPTAWERAWVRWSVARSHLSGTPVVAASEWLDGDLCPESAREELDAGQAAATDVGRRLARLASDRERLVALAGVVRAHLQVTASTERYGRLLEEHWRLAADGAGVEEMTA